MSATWQCRSSASHLFPWPRATEAWHVACGMHLCQRLQGRDRAGPGDSWKDVPRQEDCGVQRLGACEGHERAHCLKCNAPGTLWQPCEAHSCHIHSRSYGHIPTDSPSASQCHLLRQTTSCRHPRTSKTDPTVKTHLLQINSPPAARDLKVQKSPQESCLSRVPAWNTENKGSSDKCDRLLGLTPRRRMRGCC